MEQKIRYQRETEIIGLYASFRLCSNSNEITNVKRKSSNLRHSKAVCERTIF